MKIKDLIKELQKFDPETEVVVDGYETGYDLVNNIHEINVVKAGEGKGWYDGEYQDSDTRPLSWLSDIKQVVYLPRNS